MSKKKKILFAVVALIVVLFALIVGYTYSKYTDSKEVTGSAATASWSFNGAISNTASKTTTSISLAETISKDSIVQGKIAPGTSGSFQIIINAKGSEVDVDYDVLLKGAESKKPANLYFTCEDLVNAKDENHELIKYYSLADMLKVDNTTHKSNMSGTIDKDKNGTEKVITVNWEWPYESTKDGVSQEVLDAQDTEDSGITNYTFTLNIVGKQAR